MKILTNKPAFILITILALGTPTSGAIYYILHNIKTNTAPPPAQTTPQNNLNPVLLYLAPNKWVKLKKPWSLSWKRQTHAGMTIDTKRGNLLIFGSDTHNSDWDNSVHEFNPISEKWSRHYISTDHVKYHLNKKNVATAGDDISLKPRAMHTFDNIVYDPKNDSLFVSAAPQHYVIKHEPKEITHPMWIYHLKNKTWEAFYNNEKNMPSFFAGASSYDPERDAIVAYRYGIWELGPDRTEWIQATNEHHHDIHFNMEYDKKNKSFVIFGNNTLTNVVWSYKPAKKIGKKGIWKKHEPQGDIPPPDRHFPVAYDDNHEVFMLLPRNNRLKNNKLSTELSTASTYIYDLSKNLYSKIDTPELPLNKMNYMMAYDNKHQVFLLVTGNKQATPTVWAFKLDLSERAKSNH